MVRKWLDRISTEEKNVLYLFLILFGFFARYVVMSFGHNFDFESYKIVGEIVSRGGNVYAETARYNYGFIFFLIQGFLYKTAVFINPSNVELTFRIGIVAALTFADLGIACWIIRKYNLKLGAIFFLNPISIIITGYHNQFDNIAVLFALFAIDFIDDKSKELTRKDFIAITLFAISMITKHICFAFFIWMFFRKGYSTLKRIAYVCLPFGIFLLSFIPFIVGNKQALDGIVHNVFMYRSNNNYPFFRLIFSFITFPNQFMFVLYLFIMVIIGLILRRVKTEKVFLLYLIAMVAFSSAIANQYLIIPIIALVLYENKCYFIIYEFLGTIYCLLNENELHLIERAADAFPEFNWLTGRLAMGGGISVVLMTWVLAIPIVIEIFKIARMSKHKLN